MTGFDATCLLLVEALTDNHLAIIGLALDECLGFDDEEACTRIEEACLANGIEAGNFIAHGIIRLHRRFQ